MSSSLKVPSPRIKPIPIADFLDEMFREFEPPRMSRSSHKNAKAACRQMAACPAIKTTADLTPDVVAKLDAGWPGAKSTRRNFVWTLHRFCNIAVERHYLAFNPLPGVVTMPTRKGTQSKPAKAPDESQMGQLVHYLRKRAGTWSGYRLYALVVTIAYMHLFRSEALYQRPGDCDLERWTLTLSHGRRKSLALAIPAELQPIYADWIPRVGRHWLFPGRSRTSPWTTENQVSGAVYQIRHAGQAVGIEDLNFECLRRFGLSERDQFPLIETGHGRNVWVIMGEPMRPLADHVQEIVEGITAAWKEGEKLPQADLERINGDARRIIREELEPSHPNWLAIMDRPRERGKRGGYGWKDPRSE